MVGSARLFIGGLPISNQLDKKDLLPYVSKYAKDIEIIRDAEGIYSFLSYFPSLYHLHFM